MLLRTNYHTHSTLCDGMSTLRENVEYALKLHFSHLGFSGHMDADIHMDLGKYVREVRKLRKEYKGRISILCGIELDTLYDASCARGLDYIIGSTHFLDVPYEKLLSVDDTVEDLVLLCNEFFGGDYIKLCKAYFELAATTYDKLHCTFIGHFDLVTKFNDFLHFADEESKRYLGPAYDAIEYLIHEGVPFELNTREVHRGKIYPGKNMLKRIRELGGEIIISSDAHHAIELNKGFFMAIRIAKECGFDHTNILKMDGQNAELYQIGL